MIGSLSRLRRDSPRALAGSLVLIATVFGLGSNAVAAPPDALPNVLLILSDQHRWQSLPFTDAPTLVAPNLQRLADEGFRFDHFISQYPLCSPARAMIMTGRWPQQSGVIDNATRHRFALDPRQPMLPTIFKQNGFDTAYIGKWHLGNGPRTAKEFGFDHSIIWTNTNNHWKSDYFDAFGEKRQSLNYNATDMTTQALAFLQKARTSPFFVVLSWNPPHSNYTDAPAAFDGLYWAEESMPLRENVVISDGHSKADFGIQYRGYHAHISALDHELGRLIAQLEAQNILDDTIVIYMSDHGDALGSHDHIGKRVPYAESIRVPFLVRWPKRVPAGTVSEAPVGMIDLLPTLLGLVGADAPDTSAGVDYSGLITGQGGPEPDSQLLMNISNVHPPAEDAFPSDLYRGLEGRQYTYAVRADGPWLLFDNSADPFQTDNLIDAPEYAPVRANLHGQLESWLAQAGDSFLKDTARARASAVTPTSYGPESGGGAVSASSSTK